MVNDPRVTQQISRLGGVYRDPNRVDRDASALLKSSVGNYLRPIAAEFTEDDGKSASVLVLQGTIAMYYKGNSYQILVDMYLPQGYPNRPPVCYVRLSENMYLNDKHRHVGNDGKVYLPYLHEWNPNSHNLVELVVAMSSVFSAEPPVYTRARLQASSIGPGTAVRPDPPMAPPPASMTASTGSYFSQLTGAFSNAISQPSATTATLTNSPTPVTKTTTAADMSWQAEAEAALAKEAAEANAALEAVRRADQEEKDRLEAAEREKAYEEAKTREIRTAVQAKALQYLRERAAEVQQQVQSDRKDEQRLALAKENTIDVQLKFYRAKVSELERQVTVVEECKNDIQTWLEEAEAKQQELQQQKISVDDMLQPVSALHEQMLELAAENASISDALYFLDRALTDGILSCEEHLKQVRILAKQQFLVRAHLIKINQVLLTTGPPQSSNTNRMWL